jgi:hypothetical protein
VDSSMRTRSAVAGRCCVRSDRGPDHLP